MRLTKSRKLVLDTFKQNSALLCAENINEMLQDEKIDLSTIYRTLDYFVSKDVLEKSTINKITYYYLKDGTHHHYMICTNCLKRIALDCTFNEMFKQTIDEHDFLVTGHDLTVYGYCRDCKTVCQKAT